MQEIIKLVSSIRQDIAKMSTQLSRVSITHAQRLHDEWLTSDQVMFILKIGESTLKTLRRNGQLPYSKVNGILYFRAVDVEDLLKRYYINPSSKDNTSTFRNKPRKEKE
ncbi:MAG TPA: hypothetical protein DCL77_05675 [Prolixibacteraceae bacterium]|jgi:hypothetical protein|nr:hypothetical protein [Prolixibacteraceae bacterium]